MQDKIKQYKPYVDRFNSHPYAIPVTTFLILFFLSIAILIGLNARTAPPSDSRIIELYMDGQRQSIPTRAKTVGEFLQRIDAKLGQNDIVEPDSDSRIDDEKFHINVYRARPVTIIDEGGERTQAYSAATTPISIARQAGVEVYPEDRLETSVPDSVLKEGVLGEKVVIERSTPADINLYGRHIEVRTHTETVGELLQEKNVQLAPSDKVKPSLDTPVTAGIQIFVVRNGTRLATVEEEIPMPIQVVEDKSLSFGSQAIRQKGSPGKRVVTYEIVTKNGKEVSRKKIQEIIAKPPVKQIVARGPQGSFGQALAKLRQCESGGNYRINTGNGYYGAYQYDVSTWNGYFGYTYPSDAPPAIQDQKAAETYKARGWSPWPSCSQGLGLQDIYR